MDSVTSTIRRRLSNLGQRPPVPTALFLLELYGLTLAQIGREVKRSPNQITYYRSRVTPIPREVNARLLRLLLYCRDRALDVQLPGEQERRYVKALVELTTQFVKG